MMMMYGITKMHLNYISISKSGDLFSLFLSLFTMYKALWTQCADLVSKILYQAY